MRAIILAAGIGSRLRPLTETIPKSLVEINGEPFLERQIKFLHEKNINEIYIVIGYLSEKFDYLVEKYNVNLIINDKYNKYNNIYSMFLVKEYLENSYVMDGDVYLSRNFLEEKLKTSIYFTGKKNTSEKEWKLCFDKNGKVYDIEVVSGENYIMSGISYWSERDAYKIVKKLEKMNGQFENEEFSNLYWDDIVRENLKDLNIHIKKIEGNDWFEIDNLKELEYLRELVKVD